MTRSRQWRAGSGGALHLSGSLPERWGAKGCLGLVEEKARSGQHGTASPLRLRSLPTARAQSDVQAPTPTRRLTWQRPQAAVGAGGVLQSEPDAHTRVRVCGQERRVLWHGVVWGGVVQRGSAGFGQQCQGVRCSVQYVAWSAAACGAEAIVGQCVSLHASSHPACLARTWCGTTSPPTNGCLKISIDCGARWQGGRAGPGEQPGASGQRGWQAD